MGNIILLTNLVWPILFAILYAKYVFDSKSEIFVIFSGFWKNNPPFPHSYPHIHICHTGLIRASKLQKLPVVFVKSAFFKLMFGLHNLSMHCVYIVKKRTLPCRILLYSVGCGNAFFRNSEWTISAKQDAPL